MSNEEPMQWYVRPKRGDVLLKISATVHETLKFSTLGVVLEVFAFEGCGVFLSCIFES
jgi:hypothetical protein